MPLTELHKDYTWSWKSPTGSGSSDSELITTQKLPDPVNIGSEFVLTNPAVTHNVMTSRPRKNTGFWQSVYSDFESFYDKTSGNQIWDKLRSHF